ncbi:hypothetical protein WR25_17403 [Diploscapter pachys]|uniref:SXP/RAL-2 family protein Ani s 5-like cation-binding domain-containing protein n=1 Tax=Diploscapter pachys TaxID=2018661 RepID=A0A2A2JDX1_9BILA|nr:hypothetical protein WR25_17403 [Diploscapter pachys]
MIFYIFNLIVSSLTFANFCYGTPIRIVDLPNSVVAKIDEERGLDRFVTRLEDSWAKMDGMQLQAQDMIFQLVVDKDVDKSAKLNYIESLINEGGISASEADMIRSEVKRLIEVYEFAQSLIGKSGSKVGRAAERATKLLSNTASLYKLTHDEKIDAIKLIDFDLSTEEQARFWELVGVILEKAESVGLVEPFPEESIK